MLRTLVAEIDENVDNRHSIMRSRHASTGISSCSTNTKPLCTLHLLSNPSKNIGPNPRSLLRPDVNRDCNPRAAEASTSTNNLSSSLTTPPTTPRSVRWVGQPPYLQTHSYILFSKLSRSPLATLAGAPGPDPVFSDDDEDCFQLEAILSPITSPTPNGPETCQLWPQQASDLASSPGYLYDLTTACSQLPAENRKRKYSCCFGLAVSLSSCTVECAVREYIKRGSSYILVSLDNNPRHTTPNIHLLLHSYYYTYVKLSLGTQHSYINTNMGVHLAAVYSIYILRRYPGPYPSPAEPPCPRQPYAPTPCDPLQAAAIAAGIANDNESTTYSVDSPASQPSLPSPPATPISSPNRLLLTPPSYIMPKNKNKGSVGDTPKKSPRTGGRSFITRTAHLLQVLTTYDGLAAYQRLIKQTGLIRANITIEHNDSTKFWGITHSISTPSFFLKTDNPDDDILDMSGVQEGDGSDHSSDLDSTIQEEGVPTNAGQEQASGQTPQAGTTGKAYGPRQSTPNQDTPKSSHPEGDTDKDSEDDSSSDSEGEPEEEDMDAESLAQRDLQNDLSKVREAVSMAGGLASNKPDFEKQKDREGQHVEVVEEWVDLTEEIFDDLPERPAEITLRRISLKELLPPATLVPVQLDMELDGEELTFVANQRIEFLVLMRKDGDAKSSWGFPNESQLLKMYNYVRDAADHDLIMDVCLWCRVDPKTGIASIMLSTIHLPLFKRIRHEIRIYAGFPGFKCETYSQITSDRGCYMCQINTEVMKKQVGCIDVLSEYKHSSHPTETFHNFSS